MENFYDYTTTGRVEFMELLRENNFKCNAAGREYMAERVQVVKERKINIDLSTIRKAEELGGLKPGDRFEYLNAQRGKSVARVCSLYDLPKNMVNPYLYCFSGVMTAPFFAMEILRFYCKKTGMVLPFISSGREGNKGLFKKLFYRGGNFLIRKTEYDSYYGIMAAISDVLYAYENYVPTCKDCDTAGNLVELYEFAKSKELEEVTFVICSGNPFYDKRLLAEWMWQLKEEKFADIKINLVLAHCPIFLTFNRVSIPEARMSEIYLGYIAASIGPLMKDTVGFDGSTTSPNPERYLMPGVDKADWEEFREIIVDYSNMGWPNYQEILYGIPHEEAVANIILADLFAKASFSTEDYDRGIAEHICRYKAFLGAAFDPYSTDFPTYLQNTPDRHFF